jgi:hypothetical protein
MSRLAAIPLYLRWICQTSVLLEQAFNIGKDLLILSLASLISFVSPLCVFSVCTGL